jgi:hypothetical protein
VRIKSQLYAHEKCKLHSDIQTRNMRRRPYNSFEIFGYSTDVKTGKDRWWW